MSTTHKLSRDNVRRHAPPTRGVYKLFNSRSGPVRYVGRSSDLQDRLLRWASTSDYDVFSFEKVGSRKDAWRRECNLYHYHKDDLDNERHPAAPPGMSCHRCSRV